MTAKRRVPAHLLALSCAMMLSGVWAARANVVEVMPAFQAIGVGSVANVDLQASGFSSGTPPSVGGFDLSISFDPSILSFEGVQFGTALGDPVSQAVTFTSVLGPGLVEVFEVSLLDPATLDGAQPDTFVMATLSFQGIGGGISPVDFESLTLSDANANPLDANTVNGAIDVITPEPGYWPVALSLSTLIFGLDFIRRRGHQRS